MIEYEYLCEAIAAWKEGRRPEIALPAVGGMEGFGAAAQAAGYEEAQYEEEAYEEAQPEYEGDYEAQEVYEQPTEGAQTEYYDGAPAPVQSSGTEPIQAEDLMDGPEGGPTQGYEAPADGPELQPYNPEQAPPQYGDADPNTMEYEAGDEPVELDGEDADLEIDEDDDEDEEDDFERDYDLEDVDDMAGFDFTADLATYFMAEAEIEEAWEDKATRIATLNKYGVRDEPHFYQVKATLERYVVSDEAEERWGGLDAIMQIQVNAKHDRVQAQMQARAEGELSGELEPVEGISLQQWASAQARLASGGDVEPIIAELGIDRAHWDRVSAEWNARMSRDTTATIATAYGNAFAGAGQGQYGAAGADATQAMAPGGDLDGEPPVSLDRYCEILAAQSAAADQGRDANEVLAEYGINAMEFGQIGQWWGAKINRHGMENNGALFNEFSELQAKWEAHFSAGDADEDVEF